jgi:hypothetical protein
VSKKDKKQASFIDLLRSDYKRFGLGKSLLGALDRGVNRFLRVDCLKMRVLERERFERPENDGPDRITCRFATYDDLLRMQEEGIWEVGENKLKNFLNGDYCMLSFVDAALSGYSWVDLKSKPFIEGNLRIQIPDGYIYGYASFTLPRFRGKRLMLYRRDALLNNPAWKEKRGLVAYVKATNWSSLRGQDRSNYRTIGTIWLMRLKRKYYLWFSHRLKTSGFRRLS